MLTRGTREQNADLNGGPNSMLNINSSTPFGNIVSSPGSPLMGKGDVRINSPLSLHEDGEKKLPYLIAPLSPEPKQTKGNQKQRLSPLTRKENELEIQLGHNG